MKYAGVIGDPVRHSLSPRMHNAAFQALHIDAHYDLWETPAEQLEARLHSLRAPQMYGANVTIPHKEAVLPWLDEIDAQAQRIGAVNTIVNRAGRLVGYNTDAPGFLQALYETAGSTFVLQNKRAVVLGSGGAARGAAIALLDSRVRSLTFLGRSAAHVETLLSHIRRYRGACELQGALLGTVEAQRSLERVDILVNTTSVGLRDDDETLLLEPEHVQAGVLVLDMIYTRPQTPLLRAARGRGCLVSNGSAMLLYQGALAFELWTGCDAPVEIMRAALLGTG